jgi:hypothetical protein
VRVEQRFAAAALGASAAADSAERFAEGTDTRRLRLAGYVYAADGAAGDASLWLRVTGGGGNLFSDSSADDRSASGAATRSDAATNPRGDGAGAARWRRAELELPLPADAADIVIGVQVRNGASAWFDDLSVEIVDAADLPPAAPAAARYLDAALDIMQANSVRRAAVDWPALRAAAHAQARGANTAAETHTAVRYALRRLGDGHSYFSSPRWSERLRATPVSNARTGRAALEPQGARVADRFAYIDVPGRAGGEHMAQVAFADQLQNLIKMHDESGACGWILNFRDNSGGILWPMLVGIGPLLGEGELGAAVYPDGERRPIWYSQGRGGFGDYVQLRVPEPGYTLRNPDAPLAILIDESTASSAEVLVGAARGRPNTRSFGAATRGLNSGNRNFDLSDGATLVLAVALTSDRQGEVLRGPIEPDEHVAPRRRTQGSDRTDDPTLAAALEWLGAQPACMAPRAEPSARAD